MNIENDIYKLSEQLYPIHRSLIGKNTLVSLKIIKNHIPSLKIKYFKSGLKCFDWKVPNEWILSDAYIADTNGNKLIDFKNNNLHIVQYSKSIKKKIKFDDLIENLHFDKKNKSAIPYVTSYYGKNWGFCLSYNQLKKLSKHKYLQININSKFKPGKMNYGELIIKGKTNKEILLTTYICHPSLANNEVSGPSLLTFLIKYLKTINNFYTYRILFIPETIGTICYLSKNLKKLQKDCIGGLVVTCVGRKNIISYLRTKNDFSLMNKISNKVLNIKNKNEIIYPYFKKGSDERQYNSPNINLDIGSLMSTKYGEYNEYHTSLDNLNYISPSGYKNMYKTYLDYIFYVEHNLVYKSSIYCEPFLSRKKLYPIISKNYKSDNYKFSKLLLNILDYCDGNNDLIDICDKLKIDFKSSIEYINILKKNKYISISPWKKN